MFFLKVPIIVFCLSDIPSSTIRFTGIPRRPSFIPLSFSVLFEQYKAYSHPCIGLQALKQPSFSTSINPSEVAPLHSPIPLSFLYNYLNKPLDAISCIVSILSKAVVEPLTAEQSHFVYLRTLFNSLA